jgi:hypothetical protein
MNATKCNVTGVSLTIEEGFGLTPMIITNVEIKIEIP